MKRKTIDTLREVRLWGGKVIIPAVTLGAVILSNEETREKAKAKVEEVKAKAQDFLGSIKYKLS